MTRSLPAPIRRTRLHPAAALLLSLEFAALTLLGHSTEALAFLAALAAVFGLSAGTLRARLGVVLLLLAGTWGVTLTQALFYGGTPRTVLLTLLPPSVFPWGEPPGLHLYAEGFGYGLAQSLRFDTVLLLGAGLLARVTTDELAAGLTRLRLPPALGFLLATALRYLPLQAAEIRAARQGMRLRGLSGGGRLALPLLAANLRRADEVAAALTARGFSVLTMPPPLSRPVPTHQRVWVGCGLGVLGVAAALKFAAQDAFRGMLTEKVAGGMGGGSVSEFGRVVLELLEWVARHG